MDVQPGSLARLHQKEEKLMKRVFVLCLLAALLLTGCAYTVNTDGATIKIDPSGKVEDGTYQYYYYYTDDGRLVISYPNGAYCICFPDLGTVAYHSEQDISAYMDPLILGKAISEKTKAPSERKIDFESLFTGIGMVLIGLICAVFPQLPWYLEHGWALENAEPSELGLKLPAIGGAIMAICGILTIILGLFGYSG